MHDISVDQTTNGTGLVTQYSLAQWQQLNAGGWSRATEFKTGFNPSGWTL